LAILNVYVSKMNELRKYKIKKDNEIQKNIEILDDNTNKRIIIILCRYLSSVVFLVTYQFVL
jgi:hypothetical protein